MEVLEVENFDFEEKNMKVLFDGLFKEGFYVTTEFDYDVTVCAAEPEIGLKEWTEPLCLTFFSFKTFNAANEQISINNRELKKIKQLVHFQLIELIAEEINNN